MDGRDGMLTRRRLRLLEEKGRLGLGLRPVCLDISKVVCGNGSNDGRRARNVTSLSCCLCGLIQVTHPARLSISSGRNGCHIVLNYQCWWSVQKKEEQLPRGRRTLGRVDDGPLVSCTEVLGSYCFAVGMLGRIEKSRPL